jgi:hypothetical protein
MMNNSNELADQRGFRRTQRNTINHDVSKSSSGITNELLKTLSEEQTAAWAAWARFYAIEADSRPPVNLSRVSMRGPH